MNDKKIYMQLGDGTDFESSKFKDKKMAERGLAELKNMGFDEFKDSLLDGIEVIQLGGGMVSVTMPLAIIEFLSKFVNKLENGKGIER